MELYKSTNLSIKQIAEETGVSPKSLASHIQRHHRELLLARKGVETTKKEARRIKIRCRERGMNIFSKEKYGEAIKACEKKEFLELSVSEIAKRYELEPSGLLAQLRNHYPEILKNRTKMRLEAGLSDNVKRGARTISIEQYTVAIKLLRETEETIEEVAKKCCVSLSGLRGHLLENYPDIVEKRRKKRRMGRANRMQGLIDGNGKKIELRSEKAEEFWEAVEVYKNSSLTIKEIAEKTGVSANGLRHHLNRWHRGLILERRGLDPNKVFEYDSLNETKHYLKKTTEKYAPAIERLKKGEKVSLRALAREYGFNPVSFSEYLKRHYPNLLKR